MENPETIKHAVFTWRYAYYLPVPCCPAREFGLRIAWICRPLCFGKTNKSLVVLQECQCLSIYMYIDIHSEGVCICIYIYKVYIYIYIHQTLYNTKTFMLPMLTPSAFWTKMQEVVPFMVAFSSLPSLNPTTISCLLGHQGKKSTHTECHKDLGEGSMEYPPLRGNDWGSPQFFGERNQVGNIVYHILGNCGWF